MTPARRAAALLCALTLTVSACGSSEQQEESADLRSQVDVSGDFGKAPEVDFSAPLEVTESASWTEEKGDGDPIGQASTAVLQLTLLDGRTGEKAISTFDRGQTPLQVSLTEQFLPSLAEALVGARAGSRLVVASTPEDAYGAGGSPQIGIKGGDPVVMVADVLATDPTDVLDGPTGDEVQPPTGSPTLVEREGVPTGFEVPARAKKPTRLQVVPLREGTGDEVEDPDRVTVNYLGAVWKGEEPFDQSYDKEPTTFSIGLGAVIKCWDEGLVGQKEGARVMLVCPPDTAYGNTAQGDDIPARSTLVFVIDVLGVG
ncbi:hypothetical protein ASG49_07330 [Marmoricola sp. Leaf446]|uniref:FKBP-type peptidyl-prolyl cis-trans isomerase n=1 Tax=Marmoricola sp. Leaf446 TaxID=1736379 RepID=UPI0006FDED74|nr:FKBP-type peptidyl-prolyl cis-trans isomerase [Marmoricola sp. Leaf446]KQT94644.1 hypothetical protein ASG49_07330 [Marmoricola sp. Leaf446]